ncbi:hypothetical protein RhoFasB10_03294 [Rhodococcus sp. B10]|nr:hypothetical protein [Rhodococcus sp. B10]
MPYIELSGKRGSGHRTLVDEDTFKLYGHLSWFLSDTGYAIRRSDRADDGTKTTVRLHRLITNAPEGLVVDHKNHDRLDNRRLNLRVVTQRENSRNQQSVRGYTWDEAKSKWMVRYRRKFYGRYDTEDEAARAYRRARSGVPYAKTRRKLPLLPKHVTRQFGKYRVGITVNGRRYRKVSFSSIEEALTWRDNTYRELGIGKEK